MGWSLRYMDLEADIYNDIMKVIQCNDILIYLDN